MKNLQELLQNYTQQTLQVASDPGMFQKAVAPPLSEHYFGVQQSTPKSTDSSKLGGKTAGILAQQFFDRFSDKLNPFQGEDEVSRNLGTVFSQGLSTAGNTITGNIVKGNAFNYGLSQNVGQTLAGTGVGIGANLLGIEDMPEKMQKI